MLARARGRALPGARAVPNPSLRPPPSPAEFALAGLAFATNPLHGGLTKAMASIGYPSAFFPAAGAWMFAVSALSVADGGARALLASRLLSVLMGGAAWHHAIGEGHPAHAVGALLFLGLSGYLPVLRGELPAAQAAAGALAFGAVGFAVGALLPRTPAEAAPAGGKKSK